ncbi:MAG: type II toxin-antitoxin system VapC family toxin [Gemmatimonadota bacterium]|nr:type II toxin-antitoxin system VapC family toxin [Gemmatimonadota bacterium]MDE2807353.1 type II toxin-antitoxin system VapC family toxin [Gemmatimonadota bacterium]
MKRILLDTNAYTAFLTGDKRVLNALTEAETAFLSAIVIGELYAGFCGGNRLKENKALLARFLQKSNVRVLDVTAETGEVFGQIKNALQKAGTPIPLNDVWLAAQAMETGSVLVSFDAHFDQVSGLRRWTQ